MPKKRAIIARTAEHDDLVADIVALIEAGRASAARSVNTVMTATYWRVGGAIVERELGGALRADYGGAVLEQLAETLTSRYGRGFSRGNLDDMRRFYLAWPIRRTLSAKSIRRTPSAKSEAPGRRVYRCVAERAVRTWLCRPPLAPEGGRGTRARPGAPRSSGSRLPAVSPPPSATLPVVPGSGNTTVPGPAEDFTRSRSLPPLVPALVLVWNAPQPHRVGEVAILDFDRLPELVLGRLSADALAGRAPADPRLLQFTRMRPGVPSDASPLAGEALSRAQLLLRPAGSGLQVESVGQAAFFINGNLIPEKTPHVVLPGDVLHLASHSNFLFTMVPASLPALPGVEADHAFGEPDSAGFVGESFAAWELRGRIAAALRIGGHVLVQGETGSGKELVVRELHRRSGRTGRFVAINGATLVETLAESMLFGNAAHYPNVGARESPGFFGEAHQGTLFVDEFGQLPLEVQAKLLRAMQSDGEYTRLGETRARRAEVTVVAAMNQATAAVKEDLLPRFAYRVEMPPLAARMQDLPLIARHLALATREKNPALAEKFVSTEGGRPHVRMTAAFVVALLRSKYEGGVRDLENLLKRAMVESLGDTIEQPVDMRPWRTPTLPPPAAPPPSPDDTERNAALEEAQELLEGMRGPDRATVIAALEHRRWNKTKTAHDLDLSRDQLKRLLKRLKIEDPGEQP